MTKFFAFLDVGNVDFDRGFTGSGKRIAQSDTGVRIRTEVYDKRIHAAIGERVDLIDERAFVIGLKEGGGVAARFGFGTDHLLKILERGVAVDVGLAFAEAIEIGAVKDGDFYHEWATKKHTKYTKVERVFLGSGFFELDQKGIFLPRIAQIQSG